MVRIPSTFLYLGSSISISYFSVPGGGAFQVSGVGCPGSKVLGSGFWVLGSRVLVPDYSPLSFDIAFDHFLLLSSL
jgi:hypothetical protein